MSKGKRGSWNIVSRYEAVDGSSLTFLVISVASNSLATFEDDRQELRSLLIRLAFSDATPASKAVLMSLLAFASIQRNGVSHQAARLKVSALQALKTSSLQNVDGLQGMQQVAAQMLLCSIEVSIPDPL